MNCRTLFALAFSGLLVACAKPPASSGAAGRGSSTAVPVVTTTAIEQDIAGEVDLTGTIKPVRRAKLAARMMGAIEAFPVALGQRVRAGEVVVTLASVDIAARVAQARTRVDAALRDLERERGLQHKGVSTIETVRDLEDRAATAQAQLREAEAMLSYAVLRAPFDGVIAQKYATEGDLASPGVTLVEVHGLDRFEIEASVPESLVTGLKIGDSVPISIPATGAAFEAKLSELSLASDTAARVTPIKLAPPADTDVRAGQFVRLRLPGAPRRAVLVPSSAVAAMGQMERVFTVDEDQRARLRLVKAGARRGEAIEILSGVSAGDRIVVAPPAGLQDGQEVEVSR